MVSCDLSAGGFVGVHWNQMITYRQRPTARKARKVWDYVTKQRGQEPIALWKNPNCWMKPQPVGNAWGWWIAEFRGFQTYEFVHPSQTDLTQPAGSA